MELTHFGSYLMFTPKGMKIPSRAFARIPMWLAICKLLDFTGY